MSDIKSYSSCHYEKSEADTKLQKRLHREREKFRTLHNGIVLDTEKNYSASKDVKTDYDSSTFSNDLKLVYKTISVTPNKKGSPLNRNNPKHNTIEVKLEKNLKEIEQKKKNVNFNELYTRLMKFDDDRKLALEEMKKQKEQKEEKKLRKVPEISTKSKNLVKNIEEPLYDRCVKFKNEIEKKRAEQIKEKELKKKKEEDEIIKETKSHRMDAERINQKIANLLVWESKKKTKISHLKDEVEKKKMNEYTFHPKINKTPNKYKGSATPVKDRQKDHPLYADHGFTERLYLKDIELRKFKHEELQYSLTPTFEPQTNRKRIPKKIEHKEEQEGVIRLVKKKDEKLTKIKQNLNIYYNKALEDDSIKSMLKEKFNMGRKKENLLEIETMSFGNINDGSVEGETEETKEADPVS